MGDTRPKPVTSSMSSVSALSAVMRACRAEQNQRSYKVPVCTPGNSCQLPDAILNGRERVDG